MLAGSSAWEAETARFGRFRWGDAKVGAFSRALHRQNGGADGELSCYRARRAGREELTRVVGDRARQAEPEELPEGDGLKDGVGTAVEVTNSVESFYGQGQTGQKPDHQQAVPFMVADMFEAVAALGHAEDGATADSVTREVGEPVRLAHCAIGLVLAITNHAHRFPTQCFPRVKVVSIPDFHPVLPGAKDLMGSLVEKPFLGGREQFGEIVF